ncbi:hypothetical protein, partial [Nonomuraea sp. NPDC005650]|uniref:hypothetical protein n=1 Tax=Nonomuraea sp. NPDC005650 TaxID=3157045 RepID=UPI0033ACFAA6
FRSRATDRIRNSERRNRPARTRNAGRLACAGGRAATAGLARRGDGTPVFVKAFGVSVKDGSEDDADQA